MEQRKIYKTIETVAGKSFESDKALLNEVVNQIVENEEIKVTGARIWKLDPRRKGYSLLFQNGIVQKIPQNFLLTLHENDVFETIAAERTILADETDETLKEKGIFRYSASGVGSKIKIDGKPYFEYLFAVNSNHIDDELRDTLNIVAAVLTAKLKERRISVSQQNLIQGIDRAKQLQKSILPEHEYKFHDYELFGVTIPAEELGGDFFDYLAVGDDEERMAIAVGDAASKGLAAAAEAMYISGAIRMASFFQIKISFFMNRINQLVNKIFADDKFASLFYGEISKDKRGLFLYANAGHNPPIFVCSKTKKVMHLQPTGPLLGPAPHARYETDSVNFLDGDVLVIFSDGITEAANADFEFYEEKRLEKIITENIELSPKEIAYRILDDVNRFSTGDSKYQDDKTLVVIKRKENNA